MVHLCSPTLMLCKSVLGGRRLGPLSWGWLGKEGRINTRSLKIFKTLFDVFTDIHGYFSSFVLYS